MASKVTLAKIFVEEHEGNKTDEAIYKALMLGIELVKPGKTWRHWRQFKVILNHLECQ